MIRRAGSHGSALLRWQFPDLDPRTDTGASVLVEPLPEPLVEGGRDRIAVPAEPAPDASPDGEALAAELNRGYAEGLERGLTEGGEKGYADGFAKGMLGARQSLAKEAQRLAAIAERLAAPVPAVERSIEDAVIALALELARSVIGGEVARSRESLVCLIREALATAPIQVDGLRITLNPADLELVRSLAPDIEMGGAALVGDASVEEGGCLLIVDESDRPIKDRRWYKRAVEGTPHIDLSLAARWRRAMLALFDGEGA
jgi:flagellar assembly protein FliH